MKKVLLVIFLVALSAFAFSPNSHAQSAGIDGGEDAQAQQQEDEGIEAATSSLVDGLRAQAEAYFQDLSTLRADFVQFSDAERVATGRFYLRRPGRMRFEFAEPHQDLLVADGTFIYYWDSELEQQSQQSLKDSMASFLLQDHVSLSDGDVQIVGAEQYEQGASLSLVQADDPGAGMLVLWFNEDPFELVRWDIIDPSGAKTSVALVNIETSVDLDRKLFSFSPPNVSEYGE